MVSTSNDEEREDIGDSGDGERGVGTTGIGAGGGTVVGNGVACGSFVEFWGVGTSIVSPSSRAAAAK